MAAMHRRIRYLIPASAVAFLVSCPPNALLSDVEQQVSLAKAGSQPVATPQISPASASYPNDQSVTITDATPGATIQYTTDGTKPTNSSPVYAAPISVAGNGTHETIIAYASKAGMTDSALATANYVINYNQVFTPTFSPGSGSYSPGTSVTISTSTGGASIRYTTDGSAPTSSTGTVYSAPISVGQNETITAIAYKGGMTDSNIASASYTVYYNYAYVANNGSNNISEYRINSDGSLSSIAGSPLTLAAGTAPNGVAIHPNGKFLFVVDSGLDKISTYSINAHTGALGATGLSAATGSNPVYVAIDPTGKFAYVSNYSSGDISAYSINTSTGALTEITGSPFGVWLGAEQISIDPTYPTGNFLYVACFDYSFVAGYTINTSTGALSNSVYHQFPPGVGPDGVVVDPTGQYVYSLNYDTSNLSGFTITPGTGALSIMSGSFSGVNGPVFGLALMEPSANYVYAGNYNGGTVSAYTINPNNGNLSSVGSPIAAGTQPNYLALGPSQSFLYVTNYGSQNVSAYSISASTGALSAASGSPFQAGTQPEGIATIAIPGP